VSSQVLIDACRRPELLPNPVLFEILVANPDALFDPALLRELEIKPNPFTSFEMQLLRNARDQQTLRTGVEGAMLQQKNLLTRSALSMVNHYLEDTIDTGDSLDSWIARYTESNSDYFAVEKAIREGDHSLASAMLTDIINACQPGRHDHAEAENAAEFYSLLMNHRDNGDNFMTLDSIDVSDWDPLEDSTLIESYYRVRNLRSHYGNPFRPQPLLPDPNNLRKDETANISRYKHQLTPIPANDYVSVSQLHTGATVSIIDPLGRVVYQETELIAPHLNIKLESLPPGNYIVEITELTLTERIPFVIVK
jgi:hypothetical protein